MDDHTSRASFPALSRGAARLLLGGVVTAGMFVGTLIPAAPGASAIARARPTS